MSDTEPLGDLYEPEGAQLNGHAPELPPLIPYDLGALMRRKLPPPQVVNGLIYPASLVTLAGPPESAKTILALWIAVKAMRKGNTIAMMDEETGPRQIADLLSCMGVEPELIDEHFVYLHDEALQWSAGDQHRLADLLDERKPKLVILDSAAELMAAARVDENDNGAVTYWMKRNLRPICKLYRAAVLLIDHDTKSEKESRYARGSGAKLGAADVGLKVTPLSPFSRSQDGRVKLVVSKDRFGCLHRNWRLDVAHSPLDLRFTQTSGDPVAAEGEAPKISYAQKMLAVLSDEAVPQAALVDRVSARFGHGLRRETASRLLNELLSQHLAEKYDRAGKATLWGRPGASLYDDPETPLPPEPPAGGGWPEGSIGAEVNS